MDKKLKAKWVKALRSGKYKQGKGVLRTFENRFCCIGVLVDVMDRREAASLDRYITGNYGEDQNDGEWEAVHEGIDNDALANGLTDVDCELAWKMGLAAFLQIRKYGAKLPHDPSQS